MEIRNDALLTHPRELSYHTYRDRLEELVELVPNIESMKVLERREEGEQVHLVNQWRARGEVPKVARRWISPDMLHWKDFAAWNEADWTVRWRFEMAFMQDRVSVGGFNHFVALGPSRTSLQIRGQLRIDTRRLPGMPRLVSRRAGPIVERFVLALVQPNLVKTAQALQRFLDREAG